MNQQMIPYVAMESALEKADRQQKRLWIIILVLVAALVLSNLGWIIYESQFMDAEISYGNIEQSADSGGKNQIIGGDYYGNDTEG